MRTVFSLPDYEIVIGGIPIDPRCVSSMKLIRRGEDMPVKGIVESELVITLKTDIAFDPNAEINLSVKGANPMSFSRHFISRISRKGDLLTLRAGDLLRRTENPFDDGRYNRSGEPFEASLVLADLARQCGFENTSVSPGRIDRLYFDDIHGKTCREILNYIAENSVGAWYCSNDNMLRFCPFGSASCSIGTDSNRTSKVYLHSVKGPFRGVYAENPAADAVFKAGSADSFRHILKLRGRLMSRQRAEEIMSDIAEKSCRSFSCAHIGIMGAPEGLTEFIFEDHPSGLISSCTVVYFTGSEVYAQAKAADICEDESDYTDLTGYELRRRLEEGRRYGDTVITPRGVGFVIGGGEDDPQVGFFSAAEDGVTKFGGALMDGVMPDLVQSVSQNVKRIRYGNSSYILSFETDENGGKKNISFEKEEEQ
ncbi:MAG: hypothetical protein NC120_09790 [Ruminococcus sp.]|nr:hypothetical protein [Ruminococcus sp.]